MVNELTFLRVFRPFQTPRSNYWKRVLTSLALEQSAAEGTPGIRVLRVFHHFALDFLQIRGLERAGLMYHTQQSNSTKPPGEST